MLCLTIVGSFAVSQLRVQKTSGISPLKLNMDWPSVVKLVLCLRALSLLDTLVSKTVLARMLGLTVPSPFLPFLSSCSVSVFTVRHSCPLDSRARATLGLDRINGICSLNMVNS